MSIKYVCQYCNTTIGAVDSSHVSEMQLGWHFLTPEERKHIISYEANGDAVARITCEYCNEAIQRHPELIYPLQ
ncbi:MAG TPA: anti-sigma-F factor Fin [Bacillota bacterium]|nr:anti-sigma-F factor Fin [Bacillota bacterium]